VNLALRKNLDLEIQRTDNQTALESLLASKALFIPTVQADFSTSEYNSPSTSILDGATDDTDTEQKVRFSKSRTMSLAISEQLPLGGSVSAKINYDRSDTNSTFSTVNPYLNADVNLSLNQPLLKGFGLLATKRQIILNRNSLKSSEWQVRQAILDVVYQTEEAYWNLVYAHQNLDAQQQSLQRSREFLEQNELKVKVGAAAPIDILEARAEVARYESTVLQAELELQTAEDNLRKILNLSQSGDRFQPTDVPSDEEVLPQRAEWLQEALEHRPDIRQAQLALESQNVEVRFARNQALPELNLKVSLGATGIGGTQKIYGPPPADDPFGERPVLGEVDRTYWKALEDALKRRYPNHSISLQLKIPVSFAKEKAELAQARIALKKRILELARVENTIHNEVGELVKELETQKKLMEADRVRVRLEEEKVRAEEKKLSVGLSTNYDLLTKQRDFASAQTSALSSAIGYAKAKAKVNRVLGRTQEEIVVK